MAYFTAFVGIVLIAAPVLGYALARTLGILEGLKQMKNLSTHTGELVILGRLPNSFYGNPRYKAYIDAGNGLGWTFVTAPDSSYAYSLPNYEGKRVTVTLGTHYNKCTLSSIKLAD